MCRLLILVLPIPPGHAGPYLGEIRVLTVDQDNANFALVAVGLAAVQHDAFSEYQIGQVTGVGGVDVDAEVQ